MSELKTRITKIQSVRSSSETGEACLVLIYPPGPEMGKRWPLAKDELFLGRGADCDIQVDYDSVSRRHARLYCDSERRWLVEDVGSTNGTYVNDMPVQHSPLQDSNFLKIGAAIFKFLSGEGIEASYHEAIYQMTITDGLTGVHNKRYFLEFLERESARCGHYRRPLSVLMFDIDHFKALNEEHGHLTGDFVLKEIARRLRDLFRKEQLLARYGGEEFVAVLPETDHAGAMTFAERIRQFVGDEPFAYEGDRFHVTVSVGVCTLYGHSAEAVTILKNADQNLYRAKRSGRNCVIGMDATGPESQDIESSRALAHSSSHSPIGEGTPAEHPKTVQLQVSADFPLSKLDHTGTYHKDILVMPDRLFRDALKEGKYSWLLAMDILQRRSILAQDGGAADMDVLDASLKEAINRTHTAGLTLGRLEGDSTLFVALQECTSDEVESLIVRIKGLFREICSDKSVRFDRSLPEGGLVFGQPVSMTNKKAAIQQAVKSLLKAQDTAQYEQHLPLPVAWAVREAAAAMNPQASIGALLQLHESVVRWLAAIMLSEVLGTKASPSSPLPSLGQALRGRASPQVWTQVIQDSALYLVQTQRIVPVFKDVVQALCSASGIPGQTLNALNNFIPIRVGLEERRGANADVSDLNIKLHALLDEPLIRQAIPCQVIDMDIDDSDDDTLVYRVRWLIGAQTLIVPSTMTSRHRMRRSQVYATDSSQSVVLGLEPLVLYENCPECADNELFLLDEATDNQASYRSLRSGHRLQGQSIMNPTREKALRALLAFIG